MRVIRKDHFEDKGFVLRAEQRLTNAGVSADANFRRVSEASKEEGLSKFRRYF